VSNNLTKYAELSPAPEHFDRLNIIKPDPLPCLFPGQSQLCLFRVDFQTDTALNYSTALGLDRGKRRISLQLAVA